MADCIFCKIVAGEIPAHKFWEDEKHLSILSIFPNTPGFSVVLTKEHLPSYAFENSDEVLSALIIATKKAAKILDATFEDVGRCGMFFEGFGVDHLHTKLFPMHGTDDLSSWKPSEKPREEFYEQYPGFLSSHDSKKADNEELVKLTERLRETAKELNI